MRVRAGVALAAALVAIVVIVGIGVLVGPSLLGGSAAAGARGAPYLVEEAAAAGVLHSYQGDFDFFVGGGVAAFDCNDDQLAELYLAGGTEPAALFVNSSSPGGGLSFARLQSPQTDLASVTGAYPIDIDGDGHVDLAVLRNGENLLLRGLGNCSFERANEAWSFDGGDEWSTAFSAKWDVGAEWPTLAVGNYVAPAPADQPVSCLDSQLFVAGASGGGFDPPITLSPSWCTLSMLFTDWDRSGRRDLRASNDRHYYRQDSDGSEQLWRIAPGEAPRQYTAEDGWQRLRLWGMGIGSYDVTGDGYPDYYLTSQSDNKLQVLADGPDSPHYEDIALERGVLAHQPYAGDTNLPSTGWHAEFQDMNNDGYVDLFVAKGNVEAQPDYAARDPNNLLLGQPDGTFVESAEEAGLLDYARSRGAVLTDLNLDGMLDLVVATRLENTRVYRNVGSGTAAEPVPMGNWIGLKLTQPGANRDAIGSWLEVRAGEHVMQRELTIGGGHVSGHLDPVHFGLGSANQADVRITWPNGTQTGWQQLAANRVHEITGP